MEKDPREQIEAEADERRDELDGPHADTVGDAAEDGLLGPDQPGGPSPGPVVGEGGPPSPPGPATGDPAASVQERDPSLVTPRFERDPDGGPGHGAAIPAADLPPAERARLAHEAPHMAEQDRGRLRPRKKD